MPTREEKSNGVWKLIDPLHSLRESIWPFQLEPAASAETVTAD
jgi:hypothetical protein